MGPVHGGSPVHLGLEVLFVFISISAQIVLHALVAGTAPKLRLFTQQGGILEPVY